MLSNRLAFREELGEIVTRGRMLVRRERDPDLCPGDTGTRRDRIHVVVLSRNSSSTGLCISIEPAVHWQLGQERRGGPAA